MSVCWAVGAGLASLFVRDSSCFPRLSSWTCSSVPALRVFITRSIHQHISLRVPGEPVLSPGLRPRLPELELAQLSRPSSALRPSLPGSGVSSLLQRK